MVDYSKWDKFANDLSDDDDDSVGNRPVVTKIEKPGGGRIQLGPQGAVLLDDNSQSIREELSVTSDISRMSGPSDFSKNGDTLDSYLWCQDRHEVVVRVYIDRTLRAADVDLRLSEENHLTVRNRKTGEFILNGALQNSVETNSAESGDCVLDWELRSVSSSSRIFELTLRKRSPIPGVIMWWKNVFRGDREIDVTKIEGRATSTVATNSWELAHKMFQERVQEIRPTEIMIDEATDSSDVVRAGGGGGGVGGDESCEASVVADDCDSVALSGTIFSLPVAQAEAPSNG